MNRLFVYDPDNPSRDAVLATLCSYTESLGKKVHIMVRDPLKSREQEEKYHAMLSDIARQVPFHGKLRDADRAWKRLLIDAFKYETKDDPEFADEWRKYGETETMPALNHDGFVLAGEQSRNFTVKLAKGFITFLEVFGAENGVQWSPVKHRGIE